MKVGLISTALLLMSFSAHAKEPGPLPTIIRTDKDAYIGKEHIAVTLDNPSKSAVWVAPFVHISRGNGDGSYTPVYKLRVLDKCPAEPPKKNECVKLSPGEKLTLPTWDWNTGGYDQCPPRRPGNRAFKGVHQLTLTECAERTKSPRIRIKYVTWE